MAYPEDPRFQTVDDYELMPPDGSKKRQLNPTDDWDIECKVYIGGLGYGADKQEIENVCQRFGVVKSVWVARHPPGFAFVLFKSSYDADIAVKYMNGM